MGSQQVSRKHHWEQLYTDKTPLEVSWFQAEPLLSLQLIESTDIHHDAAIIDVGGGTSRLVDHLLEKGYRNLAVLDISASAIEHTQSRLGSKADEVEWFIEDITQFNAPRKFTLWHDRAVFHFLTNEDDRKLYVNNLNQAVSDNAYVIIATFAIGGPEKCSGLPIEQYDAQKIQQVLGENFQLLDTRHELHITPAEKQQQFIYFLFRKIH